MNSRQELLEKLQLCIDDPMWADHVEMPKRLLRIVIEHLNAVAQRPLEPFGYVALYCGAELFLRHKGAADLYADLCEVIPLYTASTVTSADRTTP